MSAGRKHRRKIGRWRQEQLLAESQTSPATYVATTPLGEAWMTGKVMHFLPRIPDGAHPDLANALDRRRRCSLTGVCDCGAVRLVPRHGRVRFDHEADCPVPDDRIRALIAKHGLPA